MDPAVGQQDNPRDATLRLFGEGLAQRPQKLGPAIALGISQANDAQFCIGTCGHFSGQGGKGGFGLRGAVRNALAGAFVDDGDQNVRKGCAILALHGRVRNGPHKGKGGKATQPPARKPAPDSQTDKDQSQACHDPQDQPGDQWVQDHLFGHSALPGLFLAQNIPAGGFPTSTSIRPARQFTTGITGPTFPEGRAREPGRTCSFRSAHA